MRVAALVVWVLAALTGLRLLWAWMADGGLTRNPIKITPFPSGVMLGHPLIAVMGLAIWAHFVTTAKAAYAWGAFAVLVVVLLLGFVMLTRWLAGHGGRHERGAEREFPLTAIILHGSAGVATFVIVFLSATVDGHG